MGRLLLTGLAVLGLCVAALAAPGELTLRTRRAVVFKDGYALLIKQATGTANENGEVYTDTVPDSAILGSFWAQRTDGGLEILAMRAEFTDQWRRQDGLARASASGLAELLAQATGQSVTLTRRDGSTVRGRLTGRVTLQERPYVLLQTGPAGAEPIAVAEADIAGLAGLGDVTDANVPFVRGKRLSFELGPDAAGQEVSLTLMYFTPGLRWIPTYRLTGELTDSASLALQAEVLNDIEDLDGVELSLVVGVPHLRFRDVVSPLSLESAIRHALPEGGNLLIGGQKVLQAQFSNRAGEWRPQEPPPGPELPQQLQGTGEQDLYVYTVEGFSLARGAGAPRPLWQADAPLRHLYTLELPVTRSARHGSMVKGEPTRQAGPMPQAPLGPPDSPLRLLQTQVWHQLEMTNRGSAPWTTGPALVVRDGLPIGQDLLTYTPPGGSTLLPLTVAVDIRGQLREEELDRQPNALRWGNRDYSMIRKRGTVTLTSARRESSAVRVSVSVPGKVAEASDGGELRVNDFQPTDWTDGGFWQNNHSDVTWQLELAPGETVELIYEVVFYVP